MMFRALAILILTLSLSPAAFNSTPSAYQEVTVYVCPMHPEVQSSTQGKCPRCEMKLVAKSQANAQPAPSAFQATGDYTCPMHPDVRADAPGKCPKCEMTLVAATPAIGEDFDLRLECSPRAPRPNEKVRLRFTVFNPKTGEQSRQFGLLHDKLFHLFVVSQDLSHFQHIHPKQEPDGGFVVETTLPQAGRYKIYSDFFPVEGVPQVIQHSLVTAGYKDDLFAAQARLQPDTVLAKTVSGVRISPEDADKVGVDLGSLTPAGLGPMKVELKLDPAEVIAGRPVTLKYRLTDAARGDAVGDLAPYLGAWGHTLVLSEDQSDYVHSHPEETVPEAPDRSKLRGGPEVTFNAIFPRPGLYRIWTQFLRGDTISTVSFTVRANRL